MRWRGGSLGTWDLYGVAGHRRSHFPSRSCLRGALPRRAFALPTRPLENVVVGEASKARTEGGRDMRERLCGRLI